eukprot:PITA_04232
MLEASIIEPVEEFDWVSPMVVQEKNQQHEIRICIDLRKLNDACVHDLFPTPFMDEVLENIGCLCLMLNTCRRYQIALNLKKCIFCMPYGILLGHVVYKQGLMVDPAKIAMIVNLEALKNVKQLHATLGYTGYYRKFIKSYAQIITPMEKLLKKDMTFYWDEECQPSMDVLKEKMATAPILVFPESKK